MLCPTIVLTARRSTVGMSGVVVGSMIGWNAKATRLKVEANFKNPDQDGWPMDGYFILGMVIGSLVYCQLARLIGYRLPVVLCDMSAFAGWLVVIWSNDLIYDGPFVSSGRLLQGMGAGGLVLLVPIYITHITDFDMRGG